MAWNPQTETYVEYLTRTGGGDQSDVSPGAVRTAAPVSAVPVGTPAPAPAATAPPAAGSPLAALAQNPAFAAFLRTSGLGNQIATADAAQRTFALDQALGLGTEALDESGRRERRGIAGNQESRGVLRSGQTLQRTSEQEYDQGVRRAALEMATADSKGQLNTALASSIAGNLARGADLGLDVGADDAYDTGYRELLARPKKVY